MTGRATYRFGPLERRGILGSLTAGQALLALAGAGTAVLVLDASPAGSGVLLGALVLGASLTLARAGLAGRPATEWLGVAVAYSARALTGRGRGLPTLAQRGTHATHRARPGWGTACPKPLRGVVLGEAVHHHRRLGVLGEARGQRFTAVLACRLRGFALLEPETQERRLAAWGNLLAGLAAGPVRRLQWIERTLPGRGDELLSWLAEERDPAQSDGRMLDSYLELIGAEARGFHEHEVLLAVQVDVPRARDGRRHAAQAVLAEQVDAVARGLAGGEIEVLGALTPGQLSRTLRLGLDPFDPVSRAGSGGDEPSGVSGAAPPWPVAWEESWSEVRVDGARHASFWISAWPRRDVSPMFLDALLGRSGLVRSVAVTFAPVPLARSTREVEAAMTRDRADREVRRRVGQLETARQRQAQESAMRREQELAVGHGEVRFSGFVTVSARSGPELERACARIQEQAVRSHLELRRMYGQQAESLSFTLPICRGLR